MGFAHENMETPIPFAIIPANAVRGQSPRYGSVQNSRYFQTTFGIKRSSKTQKPALLTFRIQVKRTVEVVAWASPAKNRELHTVRHHFYKCYSP